VGKIGPAPKIRLVNSKNEKKEEINIPKNIKDYPLTLPIIIV